MGVVPIAKDQRLVQVDRAQEISTRIVGPYSVSELESPRRRLFPRAKADASGPWIDIRIVSFGAASVPDLKCFLDGLISNQETDMPESNDGRVDLLMRNSDGNPLSLRSRYCTDRAPRPDSQDSLCDV